MPQDNFRDKPTRGTIQIPLNLRDRLKPLLEPGEEPASVIRVATDKRGDIGECWSIITPKHWFILNKPLGRDPIVSKYPLNSIERAEVTRDLYGHAECNLWGPQTILDKIRFSSLDLKAYEGVNEKIQALKRAPVKAAPVEVPRPRPEPVVEEEIQEEPIAYEPTPRKGKITLKDLLSERSLEDIFAEVEGKKQERPPRQAPKPIAQKSSLRKTVQTIFYLLLFLLALLFSYLRRSRSP